MLDLNADNWSTATGHDDKIFFTQVSPSHLVSHIQLSISVSHTSHIWLAQKICWRTNTSQTQKFGRFVHKTSSNPGFGNTFRTKRPQILSIPNFLFPFFHSFFLSLSSHTCLVYQKEHTSSTDIHPETTHNILDHDWLLYVKISSTSQALDSRQRAFI